MTHWTKPTQVREHAELLESRSSRIAHSAGVVTEILLSEHQLQDEEIAQPLWRVMTTSMGLLSSLRVLDLSFNRLDDGFWEQQSVYPSADWTALTSLDLSNNGFVLGLETVVTVANVDDEWTQVHSQLDSASCCVCGQVSSAITLRSITQSTAA